MPTSMTFDIKADRMNSKPELKPILIEMAQIIGKVPNMVRVEGHTDNLPIHNLQVASNWDLSSMRASKVLTYLLENNSELDKHPDRFSSNGYADTRPLVQNDTDAHRAQNRRVDIVILNDDSGQPMVPDSETQDAGVSTAGAVNGRSVSKASPAAGSGPTSVDITDQIKPVEGSHGKLSPTEVKAEHFKVQPFMPKINLKDVN